MQLCNPQHLDLVRFQRVWWDPVHQHFVVMSDGEFRGIGVEGQSFASISNSEAKGALLAKYSLDMNILAIQINETSLIVAEVCGNRTWRIDCKGSDNSLLQSGFVWSDHGGNSQDLVLVTKKGVEFHKVSLKRGQCKLSRSITHQTHAWWYAAERRLLLLGTGESGTEMRGFFLKVEVGDMPRIELPPPDKVPCFSFPPMSNDSSDPIKYQHIALMFLYHEMFIARIEPQNRCVHLFRLSGKEVVLQTHLLEVPLLEQTNELEMSVVDNLIIVHARQFNISFTYDIKSEAHCSSVPNQPLSLGPSHAPFVRRALLFFIVKPITAAAIIINNSSSSSDVSAASNPVTGPRENEGGSTMAHTASDFYRRWKLLWPQRVLDTSSTAGSTWELSLSVTSSILDVPCLLRRGMIKSRLNLLPALPSRADNEVSEVAKVGLLAAVRSKVADRPSFVATESMNLSELFTLLLSPYANTLKFRMNDLNLLSNATALEPAFGDMFSMEMKQVLDNITDLCGLEILVNNNASLYVPLSPPMARPTRRGSLMARRGSSGGGAGADVANATRRKSATGVVDPSVSSSLGGNSTAENGASGEGYGAVVAAKAIDFKAKTSLTTTRLVTEGFSLEEEGESEALLRDDQPWVLCKQIVFDRLQSLKQQDSVTPRDPDKSLLVVAQVDFLKFVFEPLALSRAVSSAALAEAILEYLSTLRSLRIPLVCHHISGLLVNLFGRSGKLRELTQLSHYRICPDSLTMAIQFMKTSDLHHHRYQRHLSQFKKKKKYKNQSINVSSYVLSSSYLETMKQDDELVEQLTLDMLWRAGEGLAVIGRLLRRHKFYEAISLCSCNVSNNEVASTKAAESLQLPSVKTRLPAAKFLEVLIHLTSTFSSCSKPFLHNVNLDSYEAFSSLIRFIRIWDSDVLIRTDQGVSKLALSCPQFFKYISETTTEPHDTYGLTVEEYMSFRHELGFDPIRDIRDI